MGLPKFYSNFNLQKNELNDFLDKKREIKMPRKKKNEKDKLLPHRQPVKIDWKMVDEMLQHHSPGTEIADVIGCCPDTLYIRCFEEKGMPFSEYSRQKKSSGKQLLRQAQMKSALDGNITMQIFLGKVLLEQREQAQSNTAEAEVRILLKNWEEANKKSREEQTQGNL